MNYYFKGIITSYKNYKIPFEVKEKRLLLDASALPVNEINSFDLNGNTVLGTTPAFILEFLEGKTDQGLFIKLHIFSYIDGEQYFGCAKKGAHFICGSILSCVVLKKKVEVDKIGFFSYEISQITGEYFSGHITADNLFFDRDNLLAEYIENDHKYLVSYDFEERKPVLNSQIIAVKSDAPFSQLMMEDAYWTMRKFFAFIYQHKEAAIIDVPLFNNDLAIGHLFIDKYNEPDEYPFEVRCLQVTGWKEKLSKLFQGFVDRKIYLRHLPSLRDEKDIYSPTRFLMTIVGLESTLDLCGIVANYSDEHKEAIKNIKNGISNLLEKSKVKKEKDLYKTIIHNLENKNERFEDKINIAIDENTGYISNFYTLERLGEVDNIAKEMSRSRNKFAHGHLEEDLEMKHVHQCMFLDLFILYLQLTYIGFDKEEASRIVPHVLFKH